MSFSAKCELCEAKIDKFETLSIYQSLIAGGIIECKKCQARYKSKFKTAWCNGIVHLEGIVFLFAVAVGIAIKPMWQWISKLSQKEPNVLEKMYMQHKLQNASINELLEMNSHAMFRILSEANSIMNSGWWIIIVAVGVLVFMSIFRAVMIYYTPLRKIESKDEDFFDIRQKD